MTGAFPAGDDERVLVAGGGMAGSLLALALGRAGRPVTVFDPKREPTPMFRNEKLGHAQIALLEKLGVLDCFAGACWPPAGDPLAYPEDQRPALYDCGAPHHEWLRAVRGAWPNEVEFVETTLTSAELSPERQTVTPLDGPQRSGRLLVLATGRTPTLGQALRLRRRTLSARHSVCLGFSVTMQPVPPAQVWPGAFGTRLGYVSLFPMPGEVRVNVFSYREITDGWTRRMSADPLGALAELAPEAAAALVGAKVLRRCEARGTDLYEMHGHRRIAGLVLIGDAFHAACPASGTGMLRILNDVDVLAGGHIPRWLATPGMNTDKIAAFYDDPVKRRLDARSLSASVNGRSSAVDTGLYWRTRRTVRRLIASAQSLRPRLVAIAPPTPDRAVRAS